MAWLSACGRSRRGKSCVRCSRPRPSWRGRGSWHASRLYRQRSRGWRLLSRESSRRSRLADRLRLAVRNVMYVLLALLPTVRGEHTLVVHIGYTSPRRLVTRCTSGRAQPAPSLATRRGRLVRLVVRRVAGGECAHRSGRGKLVPSTTQPCHQKSLRVTGSPSTPDTHHKRLSPCAHTKAYTSSSCASRPQASSGLRVGACECRWSTRRGPTDE